MRTFFVFIFLLLINLTKSQEKKLFIKSVIKEVTVYLNGANIIRKASADIPSGYTTLIFENLSDDIDPKSIQIGTDNNNIRILSVNIQYNFEDSIIKNKELNELKNKLKTIEESINAEEQKINIIEEEITFLKENRVIGGKNEPLNFANLRDIYNFYSEKIKSLITLKNEINNKLENFRKEHTILLNKINQIELQKNIKRTAEIVVNTFCQSPTKTNFNISYYVKKANWFPQYDISVKNLNEKVELILKGNVYQNTGENWENVKLKLVTTDPAIGNILPNLKTYYLDYNLRPPVYRLLNNQVSGYIKDAFTYEPLPGANVTIKGTSIGTVSNYEGYYTITLPNDESTLVFSCIGYHHLEIKPDKSFLNVYLKPIEEISEVRINAKGMKLKSFHKDNQEIETITKEKQPENINITEESKTYYEYEIKIPCNVKSENKSVNFDIDKFEIDAVYEYHCIPKIDRDAFLIARLIDWQNYNLVTGEATLFFENTYVGKSILNLTEISDTINLSFGRDKNIIVKRNKVKSTTSKQFLGNKKEETRIWKLEVKNNKRFPINLILFDQVPLSKNSEIEVIVDNTSGGIVNNETGEVKWNLTIEPYQTITLELKYRVKYPKDKILYIE